MKKLLRPSDVAEIYGISAWTLAHWRNQGRGPRYIKPGRIFYRRADVEKFLQDHTVITTDQDSVDTDQ